MSRADGIVIEKIRAAPMMTYAGTSGRAHGKQMTGTTDGTGVGGARCDKS